MDDCHVTWEQEKDIPKEVLKEFEESVTVAVNEISRQSMGQTSNILNVTSNDGAEPDPKRSKKERVTISKDDG